MASRKKYVLSMNYEKKTYFLAGSVILLLTLLSFWYFSSSNDNKKGLYDSAKVEVDRVRKGSLTRNITVVGSLAASNTVTIRSQIRGLISKVFVNGGEAVEKGQKLFKINDRPFKSQLKEAKASLSVYEAQYERIKKLSEKKFSATKTLEEAEASFLKSQAQFEKAQKDLEDTNIIAPYEGVVSLHNISKGALVMPDVELITITDIDPIKVDFKIPAKLLKYISIGQNIVLKVPEYQVKKFTGTIDAIDAAIDPGAQTIAIRATVNNADRLLKPGMFVRVVLTAGSQDNTMIVPEESVVISGDQSYVWKVIEYPNKPGVYISFRVSVTTGLKEGDNIEIIRGLKEDDIIITVGYQKVSDGVIVRFDKESIGLEEAKPDGQKQSDESSKNSEKTASHQPLSHDGGKGKNNK